MFLYGLYTFLSSAIDEVHQNYLNQQANKNSGFLYSNHSVLTKTNSVEVQLQHVHSLNAFPTLCVQQFVSCHPFIDCVTISWWYILHIQFRRLAGCDDSNMISSLEFLNKTCSSRVFCLIVCERYEILCLTFQMQHAVTGWMGGFFFSGGGCLNDLILRLKSDFPGITPGRGKGVYENVTEVI